MPVEPRRPVSAPSGGHVPLHWKEVCAGPDGWAPHPVLAVATALTRTPTLLIDPDVATAAADELSAITGAVRYAVKAGPHPALIRALGRAGHGFDVASGAEMVMVRTHAGTDPPVLCANPAMPEEDIKTTLRLGARLYVVDNVRHLRFLVDVAASHGVTPSELAVLVRLATFDTTARYALSEKFGSDLAGANACAALARALGVYVAGVSFHVGSQASDPAQAAAASAAALSLADALAIEDPVIDVGGGFPAPYRDAADWREFAAGLAGPLQRDGVSVICEPGRLLAATGSWVVAGVVSVGERGDQLFVHLDAGAYHGLMEFSGLVQHPFDIPVMAGTRQPIVQGLGGTRYARLVGPTCDSMDTVLAAPVPVPCDIAPGDRMLFGLAGAYSVSCVSEFNGFVGLDQVTVTSR